MASPCFKFCKDTEIFHCYFISLFFDFHNFLQYHTRNFFPLELYLATQIEISSKSVVNWKKIAFCVYFNFEHWLNTVKIPHHILLTKVKISRGPGLILHGHFQQPHVSDKIQISQYGCLRCMLHVTRYDGEGWGSNLGGDEKKKNF